MLALVFGATAPDKLEVVTTGTATFDFSTTQLDKLIADTNPTTAKTVPFNGTIAAGGATTKVTTDPASLHEAMIRDVSITNTHASASGTVQLQHTINGGTARKYGGTYTLAPGERLYMNAEGTLFVYDATGGVKTALAAAMTRTVLSAASSGTYTTPAGCRAIDVTCIGGGGGSGGVPLGSSTASVSGGAGSGSYARKLISPPAASYSYTVGAAGAAGASGANAGGAGGTSTFGTLSAPGGGGSPAGIAAAATEAWAEGGIGGAVATGGDINASGSMGFPGHRLNGTTGKSGGGGDSVIGGGGNARTTAGAGTAGDPGTGGGGGGAFSTSTAQAGGAGSPGVIIITEFY